MASKSIGGLSSIIKADTSVPSETQVLQELVARQRRGDYGDDQYVPDVTISWLYKPHVVTALFAVVGMLLYLTWSTSEVSDSVTNGKTAVMAISFFMIILGMMVFPSGPFIRPHPVLWRAVFAVAVLYEMFLLIILFQSKQDARHIMHWIDPKLGFPLKEQTYAANCDLTWQNLWGACDIFIIGHFVGWFLKSFILRDVTLCWVASIIWELIEICFKHMLPNFAECWWDQWILDVLVCNGLGIYFGSKLCRHLEMARYDWKGVHAYPSYGAKVKRLLLQFAPESWMRVRWRQTESLKRFFGVHLLMALFLLQELNSFFLKTLLWIPSSHYLNIVRLGFWLFFSLPCFRQLYLYMSDPTVQSLGRQTFLCVIIIVTELLIITKLGRGEFSQPMSPEAFQIACLLVGGYILFALWGVWRILRKHPVEDPHAEVAAKIAAFPVTVAATLPVQDTAAPEATTLPIEDTTFATGDGAAGAVSEAAAVNGAGVGVDNVLSTPTATTDSTVIRRTRSSSRPGASTLTSTTGTGAGTASTTRSASTTRPAAAVRSASSRRVVATARTDSTAVTADGTGIRATGVRKPSTKSKTTSSTSNTTPTGAGAGAGAGKGAAHAGTKRD